jgi:hypothetical protein
MNFQASEGEKTIQNFENQSFDAKVAENLFKMLGGNPNDTQIDVLTF